MSVSKLKTYQRALSGDEPARLPQIRCECLEKISKDNRPAKEVHNEDESNIAIGELKEKSSEWKPSPAKVQLTKLVLHPCERSSTTGVSKVLAEGEFCGKKSDQSSIQDELEKYKVAVSNLKTRPAILNSMEFVPLSNPTKMQLLQAATDSESANRASDHRLLKSHLRCFRRS